MSVAAELVREALRDPALREEIRAIVGAGQQSSSANDVDAIEPLIDAREAGRILGTSAPAVRAAAFRGTIPFVHVGRLLRFRRSELMAVLRR
jgi:excisionase family DNA binding protein